MGIQTRGETYGVCECVGVWGGETHLGENLPHCLALKHVPNAVTSKDEKGVRFLPLHNKELGLARHRLRLGRHPRLVLPLVVFVRKVTQRARYRKVPIHALHRHVVARFLDALELLLGS